MPFVKQAMEGHQGAARFFATSMSWGELEQMAVFPEELAGQLDEEDERLQRVLARTRLAPLVSYLTEVPDHFFSALTLIIMPRDLNRRATEALEAPGETSWDFYFERTGDPSPDHRIAGIVHLSGDVRLFPADGQHRLRAAVDAMHLEPTLAREEVPVVLIPYRDRDQVRQLFADLNLNAKPVNKTVGYALDSRDAIVSLAKKVGSEIPLFRGRVNRSSNSLPRSSANVITLNTLVESTRVLASAWLRMTERRRLECAVREDRLGAVQSVLDAWKGILGPFDIYWEPVINGAPGSAGKLREDYVFPHGLGWLALSELAGELFALDASTWRQHFGKAVHSVNWSRANPEWEGIATIHGSVNNTALAVKTTARFLANRLRQPPTSRRPANR